MSSYRAAVSYQTALFAGWQVSIGLDKKYRLIKMNALLSSLIYKGSLFETHILMEHCSNLLSEHAPMSGPNTLLTESGIHHNLETCER